MATERQVQEMIARCVGIAVFYRNGELTTKTKALMAAEFRTAAGRIDELGMGRKAVEENVLRPMEAELIARYGPEEGRRSSAEFLKAFEGPIVTLPCPATS